MAKTMTIEEWRAVGKQLKLIRREFSTLLSMLNTPKTVSVNYPKAVRYLGKLRSDLSERMFVEYSWRSDIDNDEIFSFFYGDD